MKTGCEAQGQRQKVIDFLRRPKEIESVIWRKEETIAELKSCLLPQSAKYREGGSTSLSTDRTGDIMAKVDGIEAELEQLKKKRAAAILDIYQTVEMLENETERKVITAIYIKGVTHSKAAEETGYSLRHVDRIQKKGLEHLEEIIEEPGTFGGDNMA
ncbi:MAG: hypothetical protein LUC90_04180 [Lachnospiraceae bacterium]|nr:hypothetical protein [Lachnospiraceae bacterium]